MVEIRSIFAYVDKKCYNGLYNAAAEYIAEHWKSMSLESRRVPDIRTAELADAWVKRVYVSDLPGDRIAFDVGLEVQIIVSAADHHGDLSDDLTEWLRISCEGDLAQRLDDWTITNICIYRKQNFPENSMSDALVPDIRNEKMDDVATAFLREYYPEALQITKSSEQPVYVDPLVLAKRLNLQVVTHPIRKDGTVFGQLFFEDADTEMYDSNQDKIIPVHIPSKTVIVDPQMFLLTNYGSPGNTIIHECVHWVKHRKVYMLEKLYNDKAHGITCEVIGEAKADLSRQATERMERQANRLTPRIQMPAAPFRAKANDYISRFMREMGARYEIEVMEAVIQQLSTDFVVSKQSAKIRLIELGFEAAIGTFTYIDGHYVKPHSFRKGAIQVDQTFSISAQDAAIQRLINPELRKLTETGDYLFIDNHFVYNTPLYVETSADGRLDLTAYARSHMDECGLVFDMKITSKVADAYHTVCFLNRESSDITFDVTFHNGYENAPPERQIAMRKKQQEEWLSIRRQMTDDPEQCMKLLLDWREMNYTDLGTAIDRDPKTISRTVKSSTSPDIKTAVRICLGLHLPPTISEKLLEVLGCHLKPTDQNHQWMKEALTLKYPEPFDSAKEYIEAFGVEI